MINNIRNWFVDLGFTEIEGDNHEASAVVKQTKPFPIKVRISTKTELNGGLYYIGCFDKHVAASISAKPVKGEDIAHALVTIRDNAVNE